MALQIVVDDARSSTGIGSAVAYARAVRVMIDADTGVLEVAVNVYANQGARISRKSPISGGVYSGIMGENGVPNAGSLNSGLVAAVYDWLKTLPDFAGAIDV